MGSERTGSGLCVPGVDCSHCGSNSLKQLSNINSHSFHCLTLGRLDNVRSPNRTAIHCSVCECVCVTEVSESLLVLTQYSEANQRCLVI